MKSTITIAALAIVLAVAFAIWQETATISVNAQTGYLDADFQNVQVDRSPYVTAEAKTAGSDAGNDGPPSLTVTVTNAYPGASVTVSFDVYNDGTIPLRFRWTACTISGDTGYLKVSGMPTSDTTLDLGATQKVTLTITAADNVEEQKTYSLTIQCPYQQAVPVASGPSQ
ncbi:hypothetical protein [Pyrobaculum neutrophilum]|uniref:Uncharacterized protein n=1 Tax=Pyrobaculum neutrophilum (strain DSM 2338 / JCM 9278 / NBRC 100436 / V24Sta) TaxID=444157 RepID=B1YDQ2_PYRNV|nr:hypothetical protein [Pyrobaculum neutrophilum]ACB39915.1 hypothetical protein Tneu_0982 [Pyrobaculum neutrophilum V24Sta]